MLSLSVAGRDSRAYRHCPFAAVTGVAMLLVAGVAILLAAGCARDTTSKPPADLPLASTDDEAERLRPVPLDRALRVGVRVRIESATVSVAGGADGALLELRTSGDEVLGSFASVTFVPASGGVRCAPDGYPARVVSDTLTCTPPIGASLKVDEEAYRGEVDVFAAREGGVTLVNVVAVEDYLLGVVPLEIGWPGPDAIEVVKAQAVAARTYVLSHVGRWAVDGFDVFGDVQDQVYGGLSAERAEITAAVRGTAGVVATHDNLLIRAFYSACCGGVSAPAHETWDFGPLPYTVTHGDSKGGEVFCSSYRYYRWQESFTRSQLRTLFAAHWVEEFGGRQPSGDIADITIDARYDSGRVSKITVDMGGRKHVMGGDRIRWVLRRGGPGGAILRSSSFDIEVEKEGGRVVSMRVFGAGNGHGVGMCQSGAIDMARRGFDYGEILRHYYRGIDVRALWSS